MPVTSSNTVTTTRDNYVVLDGRGIARTVPLEDLAVRATRLREGLRAANDDFGLNTWTEVFTPETPVDPEPAFAPNPGGAYTFSSDSENWRWRSYTRQLPSEFQEAGVRLVFQSYDSDLYSLAMNTAFTFLSGNSNGRYTDRTLMTIRRAADRAENIDALSDDEMEHLPGVFLVESPYSYNPETEVKHGGIHACCVSLFNDEDEPRGVMAVRASMRSKGLGHALLQCVPSNISLFVKNNNFPAMRLAARAGFGPVQLNSQTQVMQLRRLEGDPEAARW